MAVKKSKMIERYKHLFPTINLSKERLNTLMVKLSKKLEDEASDEDIDELLTETNDIYPFEDILKNDDRTRKAASDKKKAEAEAKKKADEEDGDEDEDDDPDLGDDVPDYVKKIVKQNKKLAKQNEDLNEKFKKFSSSQNTDRKRTEARSIFDKSEVFKNIEDEKTRNFWFKQFDLGSDVEFSDQLEALEEQHSVMFQGEKDTNKYANPAGGGGGKGITVDQTKVDKVVDNFNI